MTYRRHENFDRLMENLSRVGQGRNVQLGDLFHPDFMRRHSNFATFDALVEATGKTFSGESEMVAYLQSDDWNQHVRRSTRFGS